MKRFFVRFSGIVQGVFFRKKTKEVADNLKLKGWVKNMEDGSVLALFEGGEAEIKQAIETCKAFSLPVKVQEVQKKELNYTGEFINFTIIY